MKIILKLIFLYFSLWSRLLRFVVTGVLGLLPCWKDNQNEDIEPIPQKKPVYIKIIEDSVEKLPTILRAFVEEVLKKILPSFLKEQILPEDEEKEETNSTEVIPVPEKVVLPTPSEIFWEFHKEKPWIDDLYKSTSGSIFLSANEASLYLQEYYQSDKTHNLLIFHFEKISTFDEKVLSEHKALDGSLVKIDTTYEYLCISLPIAQNHKFYESFDLDIFQPTQLKCLATPKGIELDCKQGLKNSIFSEAKADLKSSKFVKVEPVLDDQQIEIPVEAKEFLDVGAKRNFDAMVTSTDSIESCSSSNQELSKEARAGSFRKRRNRKKSNKSPVTERNEKYSVKNEFS
ncbi:hypothetical protein ACFFRR_000642 [Megaselia abdita]